MADNIKYGKSLANDRLADSIPRLPYGDSKLGNIAYVTSTNLLNSTYNRLFGEQIIFGSASRHILRRVVSQKMMDLTFGSIYKKRRDRERRILDSWMESLTARGIAYRNIMQSTSDLLSDPRAINKHTGEPLESYLKLSKPIVDNPIDKSKQEQDRKNDVYNSNGLKTKESRYVEDFIDGTSMINTSSKKNVILTTVTSRDSSRKEYVSGGDVFINATGTIASKFPDVYPIEEINQFIYYMEYGGALEAEHLALLPHGIKHILITDYKIEHKTGTMNAVDYSFSAVAVAHSKEVLLEFKLSEDIRLATSNTNLWLQSQIDKKGNASNYNQWKQDNLDRQQGNVSKNGKNKGVYNFIEKWL